MAERLTRKIGYEYEKAKRETQLLEINNKLGKLEDIMEKYDIESVGELDKKLTDADTWKRACEFLAYKYAKEYFDGRDVEHCFNADKRDKFIKENIDYFYQQAKKDGNDENN